MKQKKKEKTVSTSFLNTEKFLLRLGCVVQSHNLKQLREIRGKTSHIHMNKIESK